MTTPAATPDVFEQVVAWRDAGRSVALATVLTTWGSSPRPAGSLLAIDQDGRMEGSVSGGCVEGAVVEKALDVIATGRHEVMDFGVTDEMAWEVGLACGGEMQVFVDRVVRGSGSPEKRAGWLDRLQAERSAKRPVVLAINLGSGRREILRPTTSPADAPPEMLEIAAATLNALRSDSPRLLGERSPRLFLQPFNPPLRIILIGAVHIAQPLSQMAVLAGYDVVVVDPRSAFATQARFPGVILRDDWPDEALTALDIDSRTAIVTLTHDPKLDDPALDVALRSPAFYVGSLGSKRTHQRRQERLSELGLAAGQIERIHGPVGLAIGARSPAEIAIAILGEITSRLRNP
jgi:xanthine dehydrogenase accessory factor